MVQFALTAQDHEFLAQDGNVTFAISDSQTNQTVYSEGFSVRGDQFVNLSTTGSQTPGYQWYIPLSQIGKLIYYSTGTAQLSFTASGKTFLDTDTNIKLPTLDNIETRQLYENMYQQSAITVEQSQAKGDFNVTLVKVGNWTHPLYFAWGPLVTVFRVDLTVTSISSQPAYLWLNHLFLLNNLGGNSTYDRSYLQLGEIDPGQTRTGFLFFSALNPDVTSITIVSTELKTPENIVYQFQVAI